MYHIQPHPYPIQPTLGEVFLKVLSDPLIKNLSAPIFAIGIFALEKGIENQFFAAPLSLRTRRIISAAEMFIAAAVTFVVYKYLPQLLPIASIGIALLAMMAAAYKTYLSIRNNPPNPLPLNPLPPNPGPPSRH